MGAEICGRKTSRPIFFWIIDNCPGTMELSSDRKDLPKHLQDTYERKVCSSCARQVLYTPKWIVYVDGQSQPWNIK